MHSLASAREANAKYSPPFVPVALFVGGTSGIGQAMAEAFARYNNGNAHIILCGRNRAAAENIIAKFPKPANSLTPKHEFVPCDATLMKNVDVLTNDLVRRLPKLNYLVLSPGYISFRGRDPTEDGIDRKLALNYYARFKFVYDLMRLLEKASQAGEDVHVMSVMSAGHGGPVDINDLALEEGFSVMNAMRVQTTYTDSVLEEFARLHPSMTFTHIWPGFVRTPIMYTLHWTIRYIRLLVEALSYPFSISPDESAEYMLSALFSQEKGAFVRSKRGELIPKNPHVTEQVIKAVWEHSVKVATIHIQ